MSVAKPIVETSRDFVAPPNYLRLLSGCLLLGFGFCIPIAIYTNLVRDAALGGAAALDSQAPTTGTIAPVNLAVSEPIEEKLLLGQAASVPLGSSQNQTASAVAHRKLAAGRKVVREFSGAKMGIAQRTLRKALPSPPAHVRGVNPAVSGIWSSNRAPGHLRAALIEIWHQDLRRRQISKNKASRS